MSRKQRSTTRAMPTRKPRRCRQTNCAACSLFFAAVLAVFAVCSAALAVLPAVWPARLAAAYCFLMACFCCHRDSGLLAKLGIVPQAFVVKGVDVGLFQLLLGFGGLPVGFQLVGMGRRSQSLRPPVSAASSILWALSTPTLSSSDSRISLCTLERTAFPGASRTAWDSLEGGFFLSTSSKRRRVTVLPVAGSVTVSSKRIFFLGIFARAFSALSAARSCLADGLFQFRGSPFLFGKLQAGFLPHATTSWGFVVIMR